MTISGITLHQRIASLRWLFFLVWISGVIFYQLVIARWVSVQFGESLHFAVEIVFYATIGPLLAVAFLVLVDHWLQEMEQMEMKADSMESQLFSITSVSADAILNLNQRGEIVTWNPGAVELFGFSPEQVQGLPFSALMGGGKAEMAEFHWIEEIVQREWYLRGHETVCYDIQRKAIQVELTAIPLKDEQQQPSGLFIILRDISSRKEREAEIRRLNESLNAQVVARTRELAEKIGQLAQANTDLQKLDQMRTEFVSLVSHQLRAPLTNMNGAVERIRVGCGMKSPLCERMLDILDQQTSRLDRLIEGVLSTSRIESGELTFHPEPISMLPLLQQVVEHFRARQVMRETQIVQKPGLPLVFADRDRVAEVISNLLDNADKYSPPEEEVTISLRADQTEITVSLRDRGGGLPPTDLERIFEKFYRLDSSDSQSTYGYGLGLYLCRKLVEAQHGRIWAENHPDGGAVFSFSLPVWQ